MSLVIEQTFPLGRFHATRWNQNPFEDRYGEWPPSPWRLLRALAARWFQYSRETGDEDATIRDRLLRRFTCVPQFCLPDLSWRGQPLRQYHPTEVAWTDATRKAAAYKKPKTTLVVDQYRAVPETVPVYWLYDFLEDAGIGEQELKLLHDLTNRVLYFGRAESHCTLRIVQSLPEGRAINCRLTSSTAGGDVPVLVADPNDSLDIDVLLAATDDRIVAGRPAPPTTKWYYARLPQVPRLSQTRPVKHYLPTGLQVLQFAIGGRVFPPSDRWIKIAERFRGCVLDTCARRVLRAPKARYLHLGQSHRSELALLSGKDEKGRPLIGHCHAYFIVWPDDNGDPTRLVCYRQTPFNQAEVESMLKASERPYSWEYGNPDWSVRLVPLPFSTNVPAGLSARAFTVWNSLTPFVPPAKRRRFRENGRERPGEYPDQLLGKLLSKYGKPKPIRVDALRNGSAINPQTLGEWSEVGEWVYIHETRDERQRRRSERSRPVRPGFRLRITFSEPVAGPLCLGHSCHFGLGLFAPAT